MPIFKLGWTAGFSIFLVACACNRSGPKSATAAQVFASARRGDSEADLVKRFGPPTFRKTHQFVYRSGNMEVDLTFTLGGRLEDVSLRASP
jgi:hypothetical protein